MDHNDMLDEATVKRRQTLVDFLRKSCKLAQDFSNEEVHKVLGILSVNSFVVHDGGSDEANSDLIGKQLTNNPKNIVLCSKKQGFTQHTTYSSNIKWQKCAGMGLNGFIFKKINEN